MTNLARALLIAAVICFAVALLLSVGAFTGGNEEAWKDGGLLAVAAALLAEILPPRV